MSAEISENFHSNCVALQGKGLLIVGASGAGKSTLTLQLLSLGADLVSDDRTTVTSDGQFLWAEAPLTIRGLIEARGIGILTAPCVSGARISAIVDLDHIETARLPVRRTRTLMGVSVPCLYKVDNPAFPDALLHYLCDRGQNVA